MIRLLADNDFDERILRGVLLRNPEVDVVRVRDIGLAEAHDNEVLSRGASSNRVVVTHDVNTLVGLAYERIRGGVPMAGVISVAQTLALGRAIEDLLLAVECVSEMELNSQVWYLPL